ncbi:hypothetical protein [Arthrobacter sp. HLT1-20]
MKTQPLGALVSKKWPGLKYTSYQATNLGGFVEKHCGLVAQRTVAPKIKTVQKAPAKHVKLPELQVTNREEFISSVRSLFTDGELGQLVRAQRIDGLHLGQVSAHLREEIGGFSSADAGFPLLHLALQEALGGTEIRVVRTGEKMMAVMHWHHADPAHVLPDPPPAGFV